MKKQSSNMKHPNGASTAASPEEDDKASKDLNAVETDGVFESGEQEEKPEDKVELTLLSALLEKEELSDEEHNQLNQLLSRHKSQVAVAITKKVTHSQFQGPLPPPSILKGYDDIVPGAAEKIVSWADSERLHRHTIEKKMVFSTSNREFSGQIIGAVVALAGFALAGYALHLGNSFTAAAITALDLGSIVTAFVIGRKGEDS